MSDNFEIIVKDPAGDTVRTVTHVGDAPLMTRPVHLMGLWDYRWNVMPDSEFEPSVYTDEFPFGDIEGMDAIDTSAFTRDYVEFMDYLTYELDGQAFYASELELCKNGETIDLKTEVEDEDKIFASVVLDYRR